MGESQRAYRCCIKEDSNDDSDECNGSDEDVDEDGSQRPFILCGCTSNMFEDPCKCLHTGCLELALGCGLKIPRPLCVAPEKFSRCCKKIAGKATKTTHSAEEDTKDVTSTATTASALSTSQVATMTTPITGNQTKGLLEGPSNGDSPPSAASAVIAGAVVGGLMAIVLLALLIYFWSQRRKKMRKASDKTSSMEHVETSDCGGQGAVGYQSENGVLTNGEYEEINEDSLAKEKVEDNEYSRLDKTKTDQNAYDRLHSMPKEGKSDGCSSTLNPTPQSWKKTPRLMKCTLLMRLWHHILFWNMKTRRVVVVVATKLLIILSWKPKIKILVNNLTSNPPSTLF